MAHRQTQGGQFIESDLGHADFSSDEQVLYVHAVDRGTNQFRRSVKLVVARDGQIYYTRFARHT
jgi:hypothetical protein